MKKYFPLFNWLPGYKKSDLPGDLSAGLTVGVMLIPQGMAYAMLAGLPPIYGLYAATVPLILYAIFGTSRQLAVGPVAMVALLIASGLGGLVEIGSAEFIEMAIVLALMVGVLQLAMGVLKLGFLVRFLSHPVIAGFTSAAALIIGFSQLKHLLGVSIPRGKVHETLYNVYLQWSDVNWVTLGIGLTSMGVLLGLRKLSRKIPAPLIVVLLGLVGVWFFGLHHYGVAIVKEVPAGLPVLELPQPTLKIVGDLFPIALTISLVGFMESIAVAKSIQKKHKNYEVDANQELIGLGIANIGGAFFQSFPVTGGFSRTAVNDQAGAKTGMAAIVSAVLIMLTLLFLTAYFYYLPKAVLAAIIMVAVFGLIDFREAVHLWKTDKRDFLMFAVTAIATLMLGIEEGIAIGVGISVLAVLIRAAYPHIAQLGWDPSAQTFLNVKRFPEVRVDDDTLIVRLDAQLFFANTDYILGSLKKWEAEKKQLRLVILDAGGIHDIDATGAEVLKELVQEYRKKEVNFRVVNARGPLRDQLSKTGLVDWIGKANFFITIQDALSVEDTARTDINARVALQITKSA